MKRGGWGGDAVKENRWRIVKGRGKENSGGKRRKMARES